MLDALYARQSVEKVDSISIESQLEACRYEARGRPCREYADRGYSGKNTQRPDFEALLEAVQRGEIARVIVYKLDRISRSILDFANMMELLGRYGVEFISATERFDTSTPIGRAMLHICIVFAQLERETIQKRVTDAYYARCRRGFYMGGRIPYGFARSDAVLDGVRTACYVPVPQEAEQVQRLYSLYTDPSNSLGDLVRYCHSHGLPRLRGGDWTTARISELLRNPVYVQADATVYDFFQRQGAVIENPVSDFIGYHACYLYKGESPEKSASALAGRTLVLAPHQGLVCARDWLACRRRCLENKAAPKTGKGKNSWLCGQLKCGLCGHALTLIRSKSRWGRYFVCAHAAATKGSGCPGTGMTLYADVLEDAVETALLRRLSRFPRLHPPAQGPADPAANEARQETVRLGLELDRLLAQTEEAQGVVLTYLSDQAEVLAAKRETLLAEVRRLEQRQTRWIADPAALWTQCTLEEKKAVADILLVRIDAADQSIQIHWRW